MGKTEAEGPESCTSQNSRGFRDRDVSVPEYARRSLVGGEKKRPPSFLEREPAPNSSPSCPRWSPGSQTTSPGRLRASAHAQRVFLREFGGAPGPCLSPLSGPQGRGGRLSDMPIGRAVRQSRPAPSPVKAPPRSRAWAAWRPARAPGPAGPRGASCRRQRRRRARRRQLDAR